MKGIDNVKLLRITSLGAILFMMLIMIGGFYVPQPASKKSMFPLMALPKASGPPTRVVSMAPAITELLFAIGAGARIKGITKYCNYPKETSKIKQIGGFYDPNFEAILGINPDLVILLPSHKDQRLHFQKLRMPTYTVDLNSLTGIISSVIALGQIFEKEIQAGFIVRQFQQAMINEAVNVTSSKKRVMLVINRDVNNHNLQDIYIAGKGDFYDEIIDMSGGSNVFDKSYPKYPKLSQEGILALNPDVIIELIPETMSIKRALDDIHQDWKQLAGVTAIKNNATYQLTGDYLVIPGPRIIKLILEMKNILQSMKP